MQLPETACVLYCSARPPRLVCLLLDLTAPLHANALGRRYFEASVEDLTAFEFTAPGVAGSTEETMHQRAWDRSIRSWTTLLESLGAPNDPAIVKGVLRLAMKGRAPRRHHSHTETIFAPEEIKALLRGTPHAWMWRD